MALDVGVHDWFEVLEFAVLEEVDDMHLEINKCMCFIYLVYNTINMRVLGCLN